MTSPDSLVYSTSLAMALIAVTPAIFALGFAVAHLWRDGRHLPQACAVAMCLGTALILIGSL